MSNSPIEGMVRVGTVSSVNESARTARVFFPDVEIMSGELKITKFPPLTPWLPVPGDTVLCLYDFTFNGDGYILGAL